MGLKSGDSSFGIGKLFITVLCLIILSLTFASCNITKRKADPFSVSNESVSDTQVQSNESEEDGESIEETEDSSFDSNLADESQVECSSSHSESDNVSSSSSQTVDDDWSPFF